MMHGMNEPEPKADRQERGPGTRIRLIGRTLNDVVVRAPWLWPVIKYPMRHYFDDLAVGWDVRTGAGSADHLASLAAGLTHVSPAPERALDVGTGTGTAALLLAREFPTARVRGVDVSEEMIAAARAKVGLDPEGRIAFKVADASALPWPDDSFDLITQLNVPPFFDEVRRVLRPSGFFVIGATSGSATPFYTSAKALEKGFRKRDIELVDSGEVGNGTYWVGRRKA
ncbi:hypothetical protein BH10ACT11_BH10ACT11_08820 [soil metagenome]